MQPEISIVCLALITVVFGSNQPEQVHLSYGVGPSQMYVTWITYQRASMQSQVQYGLQSAKYNWTTDGQMDSFTTVYSRYIYRVLLDSLKPNQTYYYRCGNSLDGWSKEFSFKTRPENQEEWSPRIAVYGDMGWSNGVSIPFLKQQVWKNAYDAIFHVGDLAYDLHSSNGTVGDQFMNAIEPIAASLAYQVVVGNHENDGYNFTDYNSRFTMIHEANGQINNQFYSFNIGPAHVIGFSSEYYYYTEYGVEQIQNQYKWLEEQLIEANKPENRRKHPWLITMAHRPMYCSTADADDCTQNESILRKGLPILNIYGLEDLFYKYNVDIIFGAHEHTYERLYPIYNRKIFNGTTDENPYNRPKAPIHILIGSAGCSEDIDPFVTFPKPWSAKRIPNYGITEMTILNKTHIRIKQRDTTKNGQMIDAITIVKGKFR